MLAARTGRRAASATSTPSVFPALSKIRASSGLSRLAEAPSASTSRRVSSMKSRVCFCQVLERAVFNVSITLSRGKLPPSVLSRPPTFSRLLFRCHKISVAVRAVADALHAVAVVNRYADFHFFGSA